MTTNTAPKTPLDGLVSCGSCGAPMHYEEPDEYHEALYVCAEGHSGDGRSNQPLEIPAHTTDRLVLGCVLGAVLTEKTIAIVQSAISESDEQKGTGSSFPSEDLNLLREDPHFFLRAVKGTERARDFLAMFITRIRLSTDRAVIQYALPLPSDSHLAGAKEQEVSLSANLPA